MCYDYSAMAVNNSTTKGKELIIFWETLSLFFNVFFPLHMDAKQSQQYADAIIKETERPLI